MEENRVMKAKSVTTIIFSIIGIVFIAIAVYGAAKKSESDSEKYKGWKTYENKEFEYEVKYLPDWRADIKPHPDSPPYPGPPTDVSFFLRSSENEECRINITANVDKEKEIANLKKYHNAKALKFKINNIEAIRLSLIKYSGKAYVATISESIYLTKNNIDYRISRGSLFKREFKAEQEKIFQETFEKLIQSFKFTE